MDDKNLPLLKQDIEMNNEINVKIDMFSYFIFCIQQLYSYNNPNLNLPLVDSFFQIQGPSVNRKYSINYFKGLLKTLGFNNIEDLSKISWFNINPDGSLRQTNILGQKEFYKTFLDHIQNSLLIEEFPILKNKNFLPDPNSITDQEFELIKTLDRTLCELFGYVGYRK